MDKYLECTATSEGKVHGNNDNTNTSNNNGFIAPNENPEEAVREAAAESDRELNEDDSTDCDDDAQRERNGVIQHTGTAAEELINDDTD